MPCLRASEIIVKTKQLVHGVWKPIKSEGTSRASGADLHCRLDDNLDPFTLYDLVMHTEEVQTRRMDE